MKKIFNLKINGNLYFIQEQVEEFQMLCNDLIKIIKKINKNDKLNIYVKSLKYITENNLEKNTISILNLPNPKINYYLLAEKNLWSSYNFFKDYFSISKYQYNPNNFIKLHYMRKRMNSLKGRDKILYFLPFVIRKSKYYKKYKNNFIKKMLSYIPTIHQKDLSFHKNNVLSGYTNIIHSKSDEFKKKFKFVYKNLSNQKSQKNFKICLYGKAQDNWKNYFYKANSLVQYNDYIFLNKKSVVINLGVEDGSEIMLFDGAKKIINVDPGGDNHLCQLTKKTIKNSKTVNIFVKSALYTNDRVYNLDKSNKFETITLKKLIKENNLTQIDLIKSDIEGAERDMVEDLIESAKKFRCQLAISIYHTNHSYHDKLIDYVDIPFKLINNLSNYNFYIEHYCYERWEMYLFCIPKELKKTI